MRGTRRRRRPVLAGPNGYKSRRNFTKYHWVVSEEYEKEAFVSFLGAVDSEGLAYAITDYSDNFCAVSPEMSRLVAQYNEATEAVKNFMVELAEKHGIDLNGTELAPI